MIFVPESAVRVYSVHSPELQRHRRESEPVVQEHYRFDVDKPDNGRLKCVRARRKPPAEVGRNCTMLFDSSLAHTQFFSPR